MPDSSIGEPLNLVHLANAAGEPGAQVPGTAFIVRRLDGRRRERLEAAAWCLVLAGDLIIDLPLGAFRILKTSDALHLPAGVELGLQSVGGPAVLAWWRTDGGAVGGADGGADGTRAG